jgi:hypothetical protein
LHFSQGHNPEQALIAGLLSLPLSLASDGFCISNTLSSVILAAMILVGDAHTVLIQ